MTATRRLSVSAVGCEKNSYDDQRQRDHMIGGERLAEQRDREQSPEHRHQIDEYARPAWPDQFHAAHEKHLGHECRPQRRIEEQQPALPGRPNEAAGQDLGDEQWKRGDERRDRHRREKAERRGVGARAQPKCIERIEDGGDEHHRIAEVQFFVSKKRPVAVRRDDRDAHYRDERRSRRKTRVNARKTTLEPTSTSAGIGAWMSARLTALV